LNGGRSKARQGSGKKPSTSCVKLSFHFEGITQRRRPPNSTETGGKRSRGVGDCSSRSKIGKKWCNSSKKKIAGGNLKRRSQHHVRRRDSREAEVRPMTGRTGRDRVNFDKEKHKLRWRSAEQKEKARTAQASINHPMPPGELNRGRKRHNGRFRKQKRGAYQWDRKKTGRGSRKKWTCSH